MTGTELLTDSVWPGSRSGARRCRRPDAEELAFRVDGSANSIAWLVWHLSRITDDHIAAAAGHEQAWITGGWMDRSGCRSARTRPATATAVTTWRRSRSSRPSC